MKMQHVVVKAALHFAGGSPSADLQYWLSQPEQAHLAAVEELRRQWGAWMLNDSFKEFAALGSEEREARQRLDA